MHNLSFITRKDPTTGEPQLPEGKRKIFISYKHSDEECLPLCERLAELILADLDVAIWYDHKLTAGKEYDEEIRTAIKQSDAFILLLTPNIISSKYVLEQEVPFAIKQQVAIIPIIAGISENNLPTIEQIVGRVHMPTWFFGLHDHTPNFSKDSKDQFLNGLKLAIANKDFIEQARLFYEKGYQNVSMRNLTPEQIFIKAYGNLFGVTSDTDKSTGIKLMESILGMYGNDKDFFDLQEQVAYELLSHFYCTNQPELFFSYAKVAITKEYDKVFNLFFRIYTEQWHSEILRYELDLSMWLFKKLYLRNIEKQWDKNEFINLATQRDVQLISNAELNKPHMGELVFDGHVAYFQKSITDDTEVNLIIDGCCVDTYDCYIGNGENRALYMAYDSNNKLLITLSSWFDWHAPCETATNCTVYMVHQNEVKVNYIVSPWMFFPWLKGNRSLPYSKYAFDHITDIVYKN